MNITRSHSSPPLIQSMDRRRFGITLASALAAAACPAFAKTLRSAAGPRFGIVTTISMAPEVALAGGDFFAGSVAGYLDPDSSEADFLAKLPEIAASPLPMLSCNSFIRRKDLHCNGPDANHDDVLAYADIAFRRARRAGVKLITFGSSGSRQLPDGFSYEKGMDQFIELLKRMGPLAQKQNVTVVVEPLRKEESNFINVVGDVATCVRGADHPAIKGTADIYHMIEGGDTPQDRADAVETIAHVEIAESEGRRMPGVSGQDFRPWFKVLKKEGFEGTIGIEGKWEPSEMKKGFATLRQQWREA